MRYVYNTIQGRRDKMRKIKSATHINIARGVPRSEILRSAKGAIYKYGVVVMHDTANREVHILYNRCPYNKYYDIWVGLKT